MSLTLFLVCAAFLTGTVVGHVADDMKEDQKNWFAATLLLTTVIALMSLGAYLF